MDLASSNGRMIARSQDPGSTVLPAFALFQNTLRADAARSGALPIAP